jgi:hypothetical protein
MDCRKHGRYGHRDILSKLQRKLDGGAGGGCPVLAIGMKKRMVDQMEEALASISGTSPSFFCSASEAATLVL